MLFVVCAHEECDMCGKCMYMYAECYKHFTIIKLVLSSFIQLESVTGTETNTLRRQRNTQGLFSL